MVRRWVAALAGLLIAFALSAQNHKITLQLQDATTAEPVGFATVSLTPEKGQAKYTLSDGDGHALLEKVKSGKYTLKAEIMGYKPFQKALELKADVNLGIVKLGDAKTTSLGTLLSDAAPIWTNYPHLLLYPALVLSLLMICFNLFGNGLRDAFNPSLRGVED